MDSNKIKAEILSLLAAPEKIEPLTLKRLTHLVMDLMRLYQEGLRSPDRAVREQILDEIASLRQVLDSAQGYILEHLQLNRSQVAADIASSFEGRGDPLYAETLEELKTFSKEELGLPLFSPLKVESSKKRLRARITA